MRRFTILPTVVVLAIGCATTSVAPRVAPRERRCVSLPLKDAQTGPQEGTGGLGPWGFGGGSCVCVWPDDPSGEHCWDDPCAPPPPAPAPTTTRDAPSSTIVCDGPLDEGVVVHAR